MNCIVKGKKSLILEKFLAFLTYCFDYFKNFKVMDFKFFKNERKCYIVELFKRE